MDRDINSSIVCVSRFTRSVFSIVKSQAAGTKSIRFVSADGGRKRKGSPRERERPRRRWDSQRSELELSNSVFVSPSLPLVLLSWIDDSSRKPGASARSSRGARHDLLLGLSVRHARPSNSQSRPGDISVLLRFSRCRSSIRSLPPTKSPPIPIP